MKLLVFGATGGTGSRLVQQALQQGHVVTAFVRDPAKIRFSHDRLRVVRGDILDEKSVDEAMAGQEGVLSALGTRISMKIVIPVVVACQIIVRTVAMSRPAALFVELGVPLLAILFLSRRTTTISDGTRNIVRAMERAGVKNVLSSSRRSAWATASGRWASSTTSSPFRSSCAMSSPTKRRRSGSSRAVAWIG